MKKNVINLSDTLKLIKKNLNSLFISIIAGVVIGFIGIFININYIEKKTNISSQISIINPLQNYLILDLFSLDKISVNEESVSILSTKEKISNYYAITKEYMEFIVKTINFSKYNINEKKYGKIITVQSDDEFIITIKNVTDPKKVEDSLKLMVSDFNKIIKPIIIKNLSKETNFIENMLEMSGQNSNTQKKKIYVLLQIREKILKNINDNELEIFEISVAKDIQGVNNTRLFIVSILITFSFFLLFIILKK
jgi:hypothetical protein